MQHRIFLQVLSRPRFAGSFILLLLALIGYLTLNYTGRFQPGQPLAVQNDGEDVSTDDRRVAFIRKHAGEHVFPTDNKFDGSALQKLCRHNTWQEGVYFACNFNRGGLVNVENMILNCVRYAIEAGASGLVMPQIQLRGKQLSDVHTDTFIPMDYLFDVGHFRNTLQKHCPKMKLYDTMEGIPRFQHASMPDVLDMKMINATGQNPSPNSGLAPTNPPHLARRRKPRIRYSLLNANAATFRSDFDRWIQRNLTTQPTALQPTIIRLENNIFSWPADIDPRPLLISFGRLLKLRSDTHALASVIISRLMHNSGAGSNFPNTGYLGVHLRTEADIPEEWPRFPAQANLTLEIARNASMTYIYVATGDQTQFTILRKLGAESGGLSVQSKWTILGKSERDWLSSMSFDQAAQVDRLVLQQAQMFLGVGWSSFTTKIAVKRHLVIDPYGTKPFEFPRDELSYIGNGKFPYLPQMWP